MNDILDFLKAGSSDYPIEVLKKAGVDMTSNKPIEDACKVFEEKLTELRTIIIITRKRAMSSLINEPCYSLKSFKSISIIKIKKDKKKCKK